jgi:hypothetical protein
MLYQEKIEEAANQRRFQKAATTRLGLPKRILQCLGDVLIFVGQRIKARYQSASTSSISTSTSNATGTLRRK